MLLRNLFRKYLGITTNIASAEPLKVYCYEDSTTYAANGVTGSYNIDGSSSDTSITNVNSVEYMVLVGSGTTEPTVEDYMLEQRIGLTTGSTIEEGKLRLITATKRAMEVDNTNHTAKILYQTTYLNPTNNPITVSEVGLGAYTYSSSPSYLKNWDTAESVTGNKNIHYLYTRDVLSSPVTIQPNETYTFNVTLENLPIGIIG